MEKRWQLPLILSSLTCTYLLLITFNMGLGLSLPTVNSIFLLFPSGLATNQKVPASKISSPPLPPAHANVPRFAYLISGSKGDLDLLWRTLRAVYHPLNYYVVHLDLESPVPERLELASRIKKEPMYAEVGNVHMITKANMVTYRGPTMVANTLHACAILLKKNKKWDWFINLSASDYPLVTQDDILYTFSNLPRNLNFIEHTSHLGWKESQRAKPLIIDPGLYMSTKTDIFLLRETREMPTSFKLFTGSAWMVLSRAFVEFLVLGWDNLPRTLLMYYSNFVSSPEGYFQTVICNAPEFAKTAVNHDMHYIAWGNPPSQHPHTLTSKDLGKMIGSDAPFARKFKRNDPVLDKIDSQFLGRRGNESFILGGWCSDKPLCSKVGDPTRLKPGVGALKLGRLIDRLIHSSRFKQNQCK